MNHISVITVLVLLVAALVSSVYAATWLVTATEPAAPVTTFHLTTYNETHVLLSGVARFPYRVTSVRLEGSGFEEFQPLEVEGRLVRFSATASVNATVILVAELAGYGSFRVVIYG